MRFDELIGFFNNALLMLGLFVILELGHSLQRRNHRLRPWLSGFLISLVCLSVMSMSFEVLPGLRYDTRTILLSVTGLVFGPIPTAIVAVAAAAYRALQGGAAAFAAILSIFFSASCGLVWRALVVPRARQGRWIWFHVYAMGVVVHLGLLCSRLLVPDGVGQDVVRRIWLPVMLVYPAATLLLSHLLIRQRARIESGRLLDNPDSLHALFSDLPVVYQSLDAHGNLLDVSPEWLALLGYTRAEVAVLDRGIHAGRGNGRISRRFDRFGSGARSTVGSRCSPKMPPCGRSRSAAGSGGTRRAGLSAHSVCCTTSRGTKPPNGTWCTPRSTTR